jgi:hypothetical protein
VTRCPSLKSAAPEAFEKPRASQHWDMACSDEALAYCIWPILHRAFLERASGQLLAVLRWKFEGGLAADRVCPRLRRPETTEMNGDNSGVNAC